ncbi:LysR substrate-binding domain-containing protein [Microbacterium sp. NPDC058389]|uniref:LysR substrate-binding domain-containing protein n=1 Tax=Microbacterium sp. NPDC058389 TaxID=3346475 RepID=UPI00365CA544
MELRSLRYFLAVVEAGSLSAAAARLRLSQPSLSVAMGRLESELGVPLLVRGPRGVEPTDAGRYLVGAAGRILGEAEETERTLARFRDGSRGSLTLAAVPALMWSRVPRLLREFGAVAPDVEVRLIETPPWTALEQVRDHAADLAAILVSDPRTFTDRHNGDLRILDWGPVPVVAACPPGESTRATPVALADLAERELLLPRRAAGIPSLPEAVDRLFADAALIPRRIRTVETIQTALTLAAAGAGIALAPDADGTSLVRFDVVPRQIAPAPAPLRALVVARRANPESLPLQRLLDAIAHDPRRITVADADRR